MVIAVLLQNIKMLEKSPTEILRKEHEKVLKILDNLEKNIDDKNIASMKKEISVLEREFDKHSLNKEEKVLFPEIEKFMPREGGPTGMMIIEHKDLTESMGNFNSAIKTEDIGKLEEIGNHIITLLREHIDKENNILFMMADMHLDDKQKKIILEKFKKFDKE